MGESEVKSAALWVGKMLMAEINYLGAVTGKVETLQSELSTLAAFLMEAVKTRRQDTLVQTALSEGRNVAYDCQDVIETYMLQVARHGYEQYEGCQLGSALRWACILREAIPVHKIRSQIDDLTQRISALKSNLVSYSVSARINQVGQLGPEPQCPLRRIYTHEREECVVVGLEKDLGELVGRLLDPVDQTVITICGMGGLGKSTLARELYHHPKLREVGHFQAFGWAPASQRLQPDRVLRTIMYSLVPENDQVRRRKIDDDIRADRAHAALYDLMRQVKCLVVVDDIWTPDDWARLEAAFPRKNATRSRIILTTRNQHVLSSSSLDEDQVHLHPMEGLDETNTWELFRKTAFPAATSTDSTKEALGREMLRHCKGVPLAIVVLGKSLKRKERVEDWKQMRDDICAQIRRGGAANKPYKEVYDVLQVSYDELPRHLKHCFLHLANFPEDYEMPTAKLCQLWVAEGIVVQESEIELEEDIAERYLDELVSRNMVQAASWVQGTNRMKACRLHDLMRDVCIDIAKREGFLQTINCKRSVMLTDADHILMNSLPGRDKRLRRVALHISDHHSSTPGLAAASATSAKVSRAPNLRSLLLFSVDEQRGNEELSSTRKVMETISKDYPLLRVFDCEEFDDVLQGDLPEKVGDLIHLRYLCLAKTRVAGLPLSIQKLQWLQTLDLRVDSEPKIALPLPNILWKMKQLRHLYLPLYGHLGRGDGGHPPKSYSLKGGGDLRLDGLSELQTIEYVDLDTLDLNRLPPLERLKTVRATCETNRAALYPFLRCSSVKSFTLRVHAKIIDADPMMLSGCEVMRDLEIHAEPCDSFQLSKPLSLQMLPQSLVSLSLVYFQLADDPLPVLGMLPNLLALYLHMCYGGRNMVCSANGFPRLYDLVFDGLFSFSHWEVEQGALQKLKDLLIINCPMSRRPLPDSLPSSVHVQYH